MKTVEFKNNEIGITKDYKVYIEVAYKIDSDLDQLLTPMLVSDVESWFKANINAITTVGGNVAKKEVKRVGKTFERNVHFGNFEVERMMVTRLYIGEVTPESVKKIEELKAAGKFSFTTKTFIIN